MKTKLLYLADSYKNTFDAKVVDIIHDDKQTQIVLNQTIFYPQGGGQPSDQGEIVGSNGKLLVTHVSYNDGAVLHKGKMEGNIKIGDSVKLTIDWDLRYKNMQVHTAGHIVDQAVKNVIPNSKSIDGNHGIGKKSYIEFTNKIDQSKLEKIEKEAKKIIDENLAISFEMMTKEEMLKNKIELPFDLPSNKPLRIMRIGKYLAMPDGGTQLKTTQESWPIIILGVAEKQGNCRVLYSVTSMRVDEISKKKNSSTKQKFEYGIDKLNVEIEKIKSDLEKISVDTTNLQGISTEYLGKKGKFNNLAKKIKSIKPQQRSEAGKLLNELKVEITEKINRETSYESRDTNIDLTIPGLKPKVGHMHPVSQAMEEITRIFEKIGFTRVRYPEVDWDWYAFEALNMPPNHPARDEWETFFIEGTDYKKQAEYDANHPRKRHPSLIGGKLVLTPHTSNGQVREMERLDSKPPIRMINIARCYRRQQDATHTQMFHQFEGLVVDENITIQDLKGTLDYFASEFYGPGTKSRIRPFHFQFTEPSFEVDFSCHICGGTGIINHNGSRNKSGMTQKCKFCKSGWHEVGGAGMVHPNVLKAGGIDPDKYTGFAFGWGIERTYTLKDGLNIDDIRLLYSSDMRFLEQF